MCAFRDTITIYLGARTMATPTALCHAVGICHGQLMGGASKLDLTTASARVLGGGRRDSH